ncbi:MAG: LamG domain-containing protein, partial [Pseudomonadota bacterium]
MQFDSLILDLPLDTIPEAQGFAAGPQASAVRKRGAPGLDSDGALGAHVTLDGTAGLVTTLGGLGTGEEVTVSAWVRVREVTGAARLLTLGDGYALHLDTAGDGRCTLSTRLGQGTVGTDATLRTGVWRHIAVQQRKDGQGFVQALFLDGVETRIASQQTQIILGDHDLSVGLHSNPGAAVQADVAQFDVARVRVHSTALSAVELNQMLAADRSPLSQLNESLPLNVRLLDTDGTPSLYIEDHPGGHALTLEVQNVSSYPLKLSHRNPASALTLTFPPGSLRTHDARGKRLLPWLAERHQWNVTLTTEQDGTQRLTLTPRHGSLEIEPLEVRTLAVHGLQAKMGEGTRPCRVRFGFADVTHAAAAGDQQISGGRDKLLQIVNHTGSRYVPLLAEIRGADRLRVNDQNADLTLRISNPSTDRTVLFEAAPVDTSGALLLEEDNNPVTSSALILELTAAQTLFPGERLRDVAEGAQPQSTPEAPQDTLDRPRQLLVSGTARTITLNLPDGWSSLLEAQDGPTPRWVIFPTKDTELGPGEAFDVSLTGMQISGKPGLAPLRVIHRGLPGFWYGSQTLEVLKSPLSYGVNNRVGIRTDTPEGDLHVHGDGASAGTIVVSSPKGTYAGIHLRPEGHKQSVLAAAQNSVALSTEEDTIYVGAEVSGSLFVHEQHDDKWGESCLYWSDTVVEARRRFSAIEGAQVTGYFTVDAAPNKWGLVEITCEADENAILRLIPEGKASSQVSASGNSMVVSTDMSVLYLGGGNYGSLYLTLPDAPLEDREVLNWSDSQVAVLRELNVKKSTKSQGNLSVEGDITVAGDLVANVKFFRIPHPLDATADLVFGSLEGPEAGVYFRGEAQLEDGSAKITLPPYFEALTRVEGRTVQLTAKGRHPFMLSFEEVRDGAFT